ncbi:MAG: DUF4827 family protein [Paludibacter sp.]|nr:DUF4827 family protein [Paludibacter sp.]
MKFFFKIILAFFIPSLFIVSCSNDKTYADQLKEEQSLIKNFIARQKIKVVTKMPNVIPFPDNVYYKTASGLYIRLENQGDKYLDGKLNADSAESGDRISFRYIQYTLSSNPDTISHKNTADGAFPTTFYFNDLTDKRACEGWQEAVSMMKFHNAEAKLIVFSKLGFETDEKYVIPYGYDISMTIKK